MSTVQREFQLTEAELSLVMELLERERAELPPEIHRTRTPLLHDQLRQRLETVEQLLARLRQATGH